MRERNARGHHGRELVARLDALGDDGRALGEAERVQRLQQLLLARVHGHAGDQRAVELHEVRSELGDVAEVGVTRAEVIERDLDAARAEGRQVRVRELVADDR